MCLGQCLLVFRASISDEHVQNVCIYVVNVQLAWMVFVSSSYEHVYNARVYIYIYITNLNLDIPTQL